MKNSLQKLLLISSLGYLMTGCASIFSGQTQPIKINAATNNQIESSIMCNIQNGRGSWNANLGESVYIMRDSNPLQISCTNQSKTLTGSTVVNSYYNKTNLWNIPLTLLPAAGVAGWVYDGTNGTANEYPATIDINIK